VVLTKPRKPSDSLPLDGYDSIAWKIQQVSVIPSRCFEVPDRDGEAGPRNNEVKNMKIRLIKAASVDFQNKKVIQETTNFFRVK